MENVRMSHLRAPKMNSNWQPESARKVTNDFTNLTTSRGSLDVPGGPWMLMSIFPLTSAPMERGNALGTFPLTKSSDALESDPTSYPMGIASLDAMDHGAGK